MLTALCQTLDIGQMGPHIVSQLADMGVKLLRFMNTRPNRLCLLVLCKQHRLFLPERRHSLLKSNGQIGPDIEQQALSFPHRPAHRKDGL